MFSITYESLYYLGLHDRFRPISNKHDNLTFLNEALVMGCDHYRTNALLKCVTLLFYFVKIESLDSEALKSTTFDTSKPGPFGP
jgi:hypothetical protein